MALVVESTASNSVTGSNNLTITKPTGVEVGDLLIAVLGSYNGAISTLSGWTLGANRLSSVSYINVQYKIADSGDVAASNYTFTIANNQINGGSILRVSGQSGLNPVQYTDDDEQLNATGTAISFTTSVTPAADGSLLVMGFSCDDGTGAATSINGYSVTGASTTWTELHDYSADIGGSASPVTAAAYSVLGTASAITAYGATTGIALDDHAGIFMVVNPLIDATASHTLITTDTDIFTPNGTADTITLEQSLVTTDTTTFAQTGRATSPTQWTNETKPSTTWTNET